MDELYCIKKCRELFINVTPLKTGDCGRLCNRACCGGDDNAAVFSYPGEKEVLLGCGYVFKKAPDNGEYPAISCGGVCERKHRPLGCMLFPLFPLAYDDNGSTKIKVIFDPRGAGLCPLYGREEMLSRKFVRAVKRAGQLMLTDEKTREYLTALSDEISDIAALSEKLL